MLATTTTARTRRVLLLGTTAGIFLMLIWSARLVPVDYSSKWQSAKEKINHINPAQGQKPVQQPGPPATPVPPATWAPAPAHVEDYFSQAFGVNEPPHFPFEDLKQACQHAEWNEEELYLHCGGIVAGLTSIVSQVKVCLKMAIDSGSHLILPAMNLRSATDLSDLNILNPNALLTYDRWFDADHLRKQLGRACPKMKIVHPDELGKTVPIRRKWNFDIKELPGYQLLHSYFWAGRPFKHFFQEWAKKARDATSAEDNKKQGITVIDIWSQFLFFRNCDDPTGHDRRLWSDLSHLIRYRSTERQVIDRLLRKFPGPFYGVHFRVENDTIWSSLEHQLEVDLDALDKAWAKFGKKDQPKPPVYLACGDKEQVKKFAAAGKERGWEVTHKWAIAENDAETMGMINELAFDFQGAIDLGIMVRGQFFLGIQGSAFSSTVGNLRDATGRYRGSSFDVYDDQEAHTHLFNDGDAGEYACCL